MQSTRFIDQLRRNRVALISLIVAITSLTYNSWRNEASEDNRTQRLVSIQILMKIGELEELVLYSHYDSDVKVKGNPRTGWAIVLTIEDLAQILEPPRPVAASELKDVWQANWSTLATEVDSKDAVRVAIEDMRQETLARLRMLD
jgi:hypothetical protein